MLQGHAVGCALGMAGDMHNARRVRPPAMTMVITRVWAMPSKWTFQIREIEGLLYKYAGNGEGWADPFAGLSRFAQYRNDINPKNDQPSQQEGRNFLADFRDRSLSGVIFDPPYSISQVSLSYKDIGIKLDDNPTGGFPLVRKEIARVVKDDGFVISCGWNTAGIGLQHGFEIIEILIVAHGGCHNDTLCTVERRMRSSQMELSMSPADR